MIEQAIKKFEFFKSLIDVLTPLELYEYLNHQKQFEVVETEVFISENDIKGEPALNITDEDFFVRLKCLSRSDLEALCSFCSLSNKHRNKLLEALKENNYASFCQIVEKADSLFGIKVIVATFDILKGLISNDSRVFTFVVNYLTNVNNLGYSVEQVQQKLDPLLKEVFSIDVPLVGHSMDETRRKWGNQFKLLCKSENAHFSDESQMIFLKGVLQKLPESLFTMIQIFPSRYVNCFFNKISESAYAFELQEFYNGYKQNNPDAIDFVICSDNYKAPRVFSLPESFDTLRQTGIEKVKYDFRLDLNKKSIEYLYKELIDRYVFDIPIEYFAYILTGKQDKSKEYSQQPIKWLGTMQDLSCFIGLLCEKCKGKDTYGIWSITKKVFVIEGITIDNKSISTEFSKIKKEHKSYIYFKELIKQTVG